MDFILQIIDFILHIDTHLEEIIANYGTITYIILFILIFIETGLVITPFLPGDSLLFAAGAMAAIGSLNIWAIIIFLIIAAFLGDTSNFWIGHFFGEKILSHPKSPVKKKHIDKTHTFFTKYGNETIIIARFVPIVRTFAPFLAGIGNMHYGKFITYNIVGGVLWVLIATLAGYFFGNIPIVKDNFSLVIFAIIFISILPMVYEALKHKLSKSPDNPS
ncbi:MAG TPA: DedA family protein [Candidatus Kapabacteria bacterium]|jgi:membrane-associated protein|nr:DedA family protein [Candidatus Kapabacteria bacterium]HOV92310.1 DedA family protein [Candidatus Kapabacteria bacterium]